MFEMLATIDGAAFVERVSVHNVPNIRKAKGHQKAFEVQLAGRVSVLLKCFHMSDKLGTNGSGSNAMVRREYDSLLSVRKFSHTRGGEIK